MITAVFFRELRAPNGTVASLREPPADLPSPFVPLLRSAAGVFLPPVSDLTTVCPRSKPPSFLTISPRGGVANERAGWKWGEKKRDAPWRAENMTYFTHPLSQVESCHFQLSQSVPPRTSGF